MLAVLVTGSRKWTYAGIIYGKLAELQPDLVIHGAASKRYPKVFA